MDSLICGTVKQIEDRALFLWTIPQYSKIVHGLRWHISPTFEYLNSEWCLQMDPFHGDDTVAFCLYFIRKKSNITVRFFDDAYRSFFNDAYSSSLNVPYRIYITDAPGIVWESKKTDCFTKDEQGTICFCQKSIIQKAVASNKILCVCVDFDILPDPPAGILKTSQGQSKKKRYEPKRKENQPQIDETLPIQDVSEKSLRLRGFESLSKDFTNLFLSGDGSDVTLKVGEKEIPAHKLILRARSSVFSRMFDHDMAENREGVVHIRDCDPETFEKFVLHFYSGEFPEITEDNVISLHHISDMYVVPDLVEHCMKYMQAHVSENNFCDFFTVASKHLEGEACQMYQVFFTKHLKSIVKTAKWQMFATENPSVANSMIAKSIEMWELKLKNAPH